MDAFFLHCRAGFEAECAAEVLEQARVRGVAGHCKAAPGSGYVVFTVYAADEAARLQTALRLDELVFARQWFRILAWHPDLPTTDRVGPLVASAAGLASPFGELFLETPDTNEGKALQGLCRGIAKPLNAALGRERLWRPGETALPRLHVCFLSGQAAYVGYALTGNAAPWPMGIPRLRLPRAAPSRSTLKLEEALLRFLSEAERRRLLRPGLVAVDLGAAPGGWTWQLLEHGLWVTAVDNGPLDPGLMASGRVEHLRVDGFRYRPPTPVHWMVCDMVEQPIRIADLTARWLEQRWCRHTIVNLKLPMKRRHQEVRRCLALIEGRLGTAGLRFRLRAKQLYHDREEITLFVATQA